jgi:hypothetical protein
MTRIAGTIISSLQHLTGATGLTRPANLSRTIRSGSPSLAQRFHNMAIRGPESMAAPRSAATQPRQFTSAPPNECAVSVLKRYSVQKTT